MKCLYLIFYFSSIPQLRITSSTSSPPSNSLADDGVRVKAEPLSPRDLHHPGLSNVQQLHPLHHPAQLQRPHSANSAMSPHISPNQIGQGMLSRNSLYVLGMRLLASPYFLKCKQN